jgi:hypothetical protein
MEELPCVVWGSGRECNGCLTAGRDAYNMLYNEHIS